MLSSSVFGTKICLRGLEIQNLVGKVLALQTRNSGFSAPALDTLGQDCDPSTREMEEGG